MWSLIHVSSNLHTTDVKLVCNVLACCWIPLSGVMFASFHSAGTSDKRLLQVVY